VTVVAGYEAMHNRSSTARPRLPPRALKIALYHFSKTLISVYISGFILLGIGGGFNVGPGKAALTRTGKKAMV
jgi:hypothetical protein